MKYRIRQCYLATRYWRLVAMRRNGDEIDPPFDSIRLGDLVRKAKEWGADRVELVIPEKLHKQARKPKSSK